MSNLIEITGLRKSFGRLQALRQINLTIRTGERVAVVGHNGSGKSTLVRCILGLHTFEGEINVFGSHPRRDRQHILSQLAFVPQAAPALRMTVGDYIALAEKICGLDPSLAAAELADLEFDLHSQLRKPFGGLSGGMKQKLLIGVALARRPRLLILDEPTAGLDAPSRARFFGRLAQLPHETAFMLVSHRVDELAGLVSRTLELDQGQVALDDVVAGHGGDLTARYQARLLFSSVPESVARTLAEWSILPEEQNPGCYAGVIPGPDRFRFLAMVTRWAGLVENCQLTPAEKNTNRSTDA